MNIDNEQAIFVDRSDAGRQLAGMLANYRIGRTVVLAIPSGGVPVGVELARALNAAFDVVVVRRISFPYNPEAGYGAIAEDGTMMLNEPLVQELQLPERQIQEQAAAVRAQLQHRMSIYRTVLPPAAIEGKTAIITDDGLASGFTMLAAVKSVRQRKAARVIVAVPTASGTAYDRVRPEVDDLTTVVTSRQYPFAVASFYRHWYDLTDEEVLQRLTEWQKGMTGTDRSY